MSVTKFQVAFDIQSAVYYCGQTVFGQIHLTVDTLLEIRGVVIRITGSADVKWMDAHNHNHSTGGTNREVYIGDKYYVVGGPDGKVVLEPGQHVYHFQKLLSPNLPSSFEGAHGSIRYCVEASLDRPWKIDNKCMALFTVISPIDLRLHPRARCPVERTVERKFSYIWRSAGHMSMTVNLPVGGYIPGQQIPIRVSVVNKSDVDITNITCRLRRNTDFHSRGPERKTKAEKTTLAIVHFGSVGTKSFKTTTRNLDVPVIHSYNVAFSSVIDMNFYLKFDIALGMFHNDVELRIPVVIGTIPVDDVPEPGVSNVTSYRMPIGSISTSAPVDHGRVTASVSGVSSAAMTAFTPRDHGRATASVSGVSSAAMTAFTPANRARRPTGTEIDDLPPPYHVAVQGLPMCSKSMC